jgi:hypothetical protein
MSAVGEVVEGAGSLGVSAFWISSAFEPTHVVWGHCSQRQKGSGVPQ